MFVDVHCHILPGIDDGARDVGVAIEMARQAVADGTRAIVCTPHVNPGVYDHDVDFITRQVVKLQQVFDELQIDLQLTPGGDVHIVADLCARLSDGRAPRIGSSRYFLLELPRDLVPPRIDREISRILAAGYVPILTHPERLAWVPDRIPLLNSLHEEGCLFQITAGSLVGRFGERARALSLDFLKRGQIDIIASDAHDTVHRKPVLSIARDFVASMLNMDAANQMVLHIPQAILNDAPQESLPRMPEIGGIVASQEKSAGLLQRLWRRF